MRFLELLRSMWIYIKDDKFLFICFAILSFLQMFMALLYGYLFGLSVETLIDGNLNKFVIILFIYSLYGFLDVAVIMVLRDFAYNKVEINFIKKISKDLYEKALNLPVQAYDEHTSGEIVNRIYQDPLKIIAVMRRIVYAFAKLFVAIFILGLAFTISWILALEFIGVIMFNFLVSRIYYPKIKSIQKEISEMSDKYVATGNQTLYGIRDIKGLGLKNIMNQQMNIKVDDLYDKQKQSRKYEIWFTAIVFTIHTFFEFFIFLTLGYFILQGSITMTLFVAYQWYVWRLFDITRELTDLGAVCQKTIVALVRVEELLKNKLYPDDFFGNQEVEKVQGNVEFKNISFAYNNDKKVLKNLSFKIETGKKIAIVGKSGMGKTTIFNLLLRFYEPTGGKILIDGINLTDFNEESIRKHIAIIRQEPYIFNRTIRENFQLIKEDITEEEIKQLCKQVYIDDYILTLPAGYDTLIGEGGVNLSGGQKQRLAIARSMAKDAKIMLFDESTSSLDNESQAYIKKTIDKLAKNHTIIIVAHRLSTIIDADVIFLVDKGKIMAVGTHQELLKTSDVYRKLYRPELFELNI